MPRPVLVIYLGGRRQGYLDLVSTSSRLGLNIELVETRSWTESRPGPVHARSCEARAWSGMYPPRVHARTAPLGHGTPRTPAAASGRKGPPAMGGPCLTPRPRLAARSGRLYYETRLGYCLDSSNNTLRHPTRGKVPIWPMGHIR